MIGRVVSQTDAPGEDGVSQRDGPRGPGVFMLLTLLACWALAAVGTQVAGLREVMAALTALIPLVVAAALSRTEAGPRRPLLRQLDPRLGAGWYLVAMIVPVAAVGAARLVLDGLGGGADAVTAPTPRLAALALLFALGEPGWRGYALPRLQDRRTALGGALAVGTAWALAWLPLAATGADIGAVGLAAVAAGLVALSVVCASLFNATGGSTLITGVACASLVVAAGALLPATPAGAVAAAGAVIVLALVAVAGFGPSALAPGAAMTTARLAPDPAAR